MKLEDYQRAHARSARTSEVKNWVRRVWAGLTVVAILALSGCTSGVAISSPQETRPAAAATVEPAEHQLVIIAVDFDPALDSSQLAAGGGVSLMVAVENRGYSDESVVRLSARLLDPGADSTSSELLNETVILTELAAGQTRVVRFPQVSTFPLLESYRLEVTVDPAPGEVETGDNFRVYDIVISGQ
jgi:hypothetical protein